MIIKRMLAIGLIAGLAAVILTSCNSGSSSVPPPPGTGALFIFLGDTPICDVISARMEISAMSLTLQGTTSARSIYPANTAPSVRPNLGEYKDFSTIFNLGSMLEGTYTQATMSIPLLQLGLYDASVNPPLRVVTATLSSAKPTFNIDPPLVVTKGKVSALQVDFDLLRSVTLGVDAKGNPTARVTPVFHAAGLTADPTTGFATLDDLVGFVRTVAVSSTNASFVGSFQLQMLDTSALSTAPAVSVSIPNLKVLNPPMELNQLLTGSFVEVNGYVDSNGNLVANTVEVEDYENVSQNKIAYLGVISSLIKDSNGNLTGFNFWVRQEEPDQSSSVPIDSILQVNLTSSTTFDFSSRSVNFANLTFAPSALAPGQELVVHGTFTKPPAPAAGQPAPNPPPPITVAPDKVFLKLQTLQGSAGSLVQVGSDNKTGAFQFSPCCTLLQGSPIYVLTNNATTFVNVSGLSALAPQPTILVKGLPFFEPQGGTFNGVSVPAGTLVVLAKQVHQIP